MRYRGGPFAFDEPLPSYWYYKLYYLDNASNYEKEYINLVISGMPSTKPMLHIVMGDDRLDRIDEYQHEQRFPSRSAAIVALIDWALDQRPDLKPEKRQRRQPPGDAGAGGGE